MNGKQIKVLTEISVLSFFKLYIKVYLSFQTNGVAGLERTKTPKKKRNAGKIH